jgi:hypothetical protein
MFLNNKYTRIYYNIISSRMPPSLEEYVEIHHIIPRSLGGTNNKNNLIMLTAREHFIMHRLLCKMTEGLNRAKMYYAFNMMLVSNNKQQRYTGKLTSASYMMLKKEVAKNTSLHHKGLKKPHSKDKPRKIRPPISDETRKKMSESRKILWQTEDYKNTNKRENYKHSEETKLKMSFKAKGKDSPTKGRKYTEEQRIARSILSSKIMSDPVIRKKISESKKIKKDQL